MSKSACDDAQGSAGDWGPTEDYAQNVRSIWSLVGLFETRGWRITAFATGHGPIRYTADGIAELRRLLANAF